MEKYRVQVEKKAQQDFDKIYKSGNRASIAKVESIVKELALHPEKGIGKPEQLKENFSGYWSRRINKKDRMIYQIIEEPDKKVIVITALGHY